MARRCFYSFHYKPDAFRAAKVRNMGVVDGNRPATDNDWETVTKGGPAAIRRWIDAQLQGRTVTIVLVGSQTAGRRWINYEIEQSWAKGMGVVGVRIHGLLDEAQKTSRRGANPFNEITISGVGNLGRVVELHDPAGADSKATYAHIKRNLPGWIDRAVDIRAEAP